MRAKPLEAGVRFWPVAALLVVAGCAPEVQPVVFIGSDWRTASGGRVTVAEFEALRQSCVPKPVTLPFDRERQFPTPERDNPIYRPGGEALANAPSTGIAAPDNPVRLATAQGHTVVFRTLDECLGEKGLVRDP